jgi:XTP/dITP diphosphohydrolase
VRLLVATRSGPKLEEIRRLLEGLPGLDIVAPGDVGLDPDPEEEGIEMYETFEENAMAKARWFHERTGVPAVADDSGLEVDALSGAPGVRSRRFAPPSFRRADETEDAANLRFLTDRLEGVEEGGRGARFVCAAAVVGLNRDAWVVRGEVEGTILREPRGRGGFGYDPVFLDPSCDRTFAELNAREKEDRSHRGAAFRKIRNHLEEWLGIGSREAGFLDAGSPDREDGERAGHG